MRSARVSPGARAADAAHSPYSSIVITRSSIRQRVGAQLKLDDERARQRLLGGARGAGIALKARSRQRVEREALGAFVALLGARAVERALAFLAVKAGDMATVKRQPGDAVAVDIHAADAKPGQRHLVDLGQRGVRR